MKTGAAPGDFLPGTETLTLFSQETHFVLTEIGYG